MQDDGRFLQTRMPQLHRGLVQICSRAVENSEVLAKSCLIAKIETCIKIKLISVHLSNLNQQSKGKNNRKTYQQNIQIQQIRRIFGEIPVFSSGLWAPRSQACSHGALQPSVPWITNHGDSYVPNNLGFWGFASSILATFQVLSEMQKIKVLLYVTFVFLQRIE